MRNIFSKVVTGSMIAGAALMVTACSKGENAEINNTAAVEMNATDPMMDGTTNDVTAIDAGTGADTNMAADTNMTMDANATTTTNTGTTDADMTNGM